MMIFHIAIFSLLLVNSSFTFASDLTNLDQLLSIALEENSGLKSTEEEARSEKKKITSEYNLPDPSIGISELDRGSKTQYFTIQQKFNFPTKYYLKGKSQKQKYKASLGMLKLDKLKLREEIVNLYFSIYAFQKIIDLNRTNLQIVKDSARVAEKKYAAGESSQSNSMKAHLEITQLEIDLLNLQKEEESYQNKLKALLNQTLRKDLKLNNLNLPPPTLNINLLEKINAQIKSYLDENAPAIEIKKRQFESAKFDRKLAKWDFAPDFGVQYQQRISGFPEDSKIVSINATIPLWFWKNSANASRASAKANAMEYKYRDTELKLIAKFRSLKSKIEKANKTLIIYKTTLMPQADGAYRSTRSAYKAGKTNFLNLLDSERSLYKVKQNYYKSLVNIVKDITEIETLIGGSISSLKGTKEALL